MRNLIVYACGITVALSGACTSTDARHGERDDRPAVIDSLAALPPLGITIPPFSYPSIRGWKFDRPRLAIGHTVVALVDSGAKGSDPAIQDFDSLKHRYPAMRFAIVFNRVGQPRDSVSDTAQWTRFADVGFAGARIADAWAPGVRDTSDPKRHIELRLPSFLVISDSGRVLARAAGRPIPGLIPVLDSLKHFRDSVEAAEGAAIVAKARPALERAFPSFDPTTLIFRDSVAVHLDGTCGGEETVEHGIIPATIQLIELSARNPGVSATVDIVSVADVYPVDKDGICASEKLGVTPRVRKGRYRIDLFWSSANPGDGIEHGSWMTEFTMARMDDSASYGGMGLVPAAEDGKHFALPSGVSLEMLRARIDSIRTARK